jgi:hypothetical protein
MRALVSELGSRECGNSVQSCRSNRRKVEAFSVPIQRLPQAVGEETLIQDLLIEAGSPSTGI